MELVAGQQRTSAARTARSAQDSLSALYPALEHGDLIAQEEEFGLLATVGAANGASPPNTRAAR